MITEWQPLAMRSLKRTYNYRKEKSGIEKARKFRKKIFDRVKSLKSFPKLGKVVKSLVDSEFEYRFIIEGHFKIIYRIEKDKIIIIEFFDSRQSPDKLIF